MANNYVFNDILPVALLKLAALESAKDLATKVNDHIVTFRRNDDGGAASPPAGFKLPRLRCRFLSSGLQMPAFRFRWRQRPLLTNPSAVRICLQW